MLEPLSADVAEIRLIAGMRGHVQFQVLLIDEHFIALLTSEKMSFAVHYSKMSFQRLDGSDVGATFFAVKLVRVQMRSLM